MFPWRFLTLSVSVVVCCVRTSDSVREVRNRHGALCHILMLIVYDAELAVSTLFLPLVACYIITRDVLDGCMGINSALHAREISGFHLCPWV